MDRDEDITSLLEVTNHRHVPLSSYLPILELLQTDSTDGARVGAAGWAPGRSVPLWARAALRAVGFGLQAIDGPHGLLVDRVLHARTGDLEKTLKDLQLSCVCRLYTSTDATVSLTQVLLDLHL